MTDQKSNLWLIIISILLALNLAATGYLFFNKNNNASQQNMPESLKISSAEAMQYVKPLVDTFNSDKYKNIYGLFDPLARVQLQEDVVSTEMEKLKNMIGNISEYAYERAEFAGNQDGQKIYNLFYKVKLDNKIFNSGELKVTVLKKEDGLGLFGFFVNGRTGTNQ